MRTVYVSFLLVHLWILAISALGEYHLACQSQGCLCRGTDSAVLHCNFTQSIFYLPKSVVTSLKHVKITGINYSVHIYNQKYDNSWAVLESFEIYGHGGRRQHLNLPYNFTRKLSRIKLLRIRNAGLVSIEKYAFYNLNAMEELDISSNELLNIQEVKHAFSKYSANKLEILNISGIHSSNTMRLFTRVDLFPLKSLLCLDISWTRAFLLNPYLIDDSMKPYMPYMYFIYNIFPNLETLNISGTVYNYRPEHTNCTYRMTFVTMFKNLHVLRMDYWAANEMDSNSTVATLPCHNIFDSEIHGCYLLPPKLKELTLNHAHAMKFYIDFEKDVCFSSKLEHLFLRNLIVSGPVGKITGLRHLKSIDISNTRFPFSLQLFSDMPSLDGIEASANALYKIEKESGFVDLFAKNIILKEVSLSDNGILELPYNLFSRNILLESIDLSKNRLQYLKLNLTPCSHLHQLSVANNRLIMIDSSVTNHLDSLISATNENKVSITIDLNKLSCSCDGATLATWIQKTNVIVNEKENFTCDSNERQKYMNDYNNTARNCSTENSTYLDITFPETMTKAKKTEHLYIAGGILGCGLCALCFFIVILLKRKYCSRRLPELVEYSLQERNMENDEHSDIISNAEELQMISQNTVSNRYDREMSESVYISNDNESQSLCWKPYRRETSVPDSIRQQDSTEQQNNVSAMYHRKFSVSGPACASHDKNSRDNDSETPVPDSIYFIGLTETPFESNNCKPHFAAFLAYSHHDKDFVVSKLYKTLQRQLEKHIPSWNKELLTVLYDKNFLPGQCTMDLTRAAVFNSYVTVAIVSDSFIKSSWCHYEIEAAIEAKVPIISVYLPGCDTDKFPAIMKYIYHNHVRMFWPEAADNRLELSVEEVGIIRDLAFSISAYVKQPGP